MGKKSGGGGAQMPSPQEYIPLVNAQAQANRVNTYTPYGSTVFSPVPGSRGGNSGPASSSGPAGGKQSGGGALGGAVQQVQDRASSGGAGGGSGVTPMQSTTRFSPELRRLFNQQTSMAGTSASPENFNQDIESATFQRSMNLLNPGFEQQSRSFQQSMADRGLPVGGSAYDDEFANIQRAQNSAKENAALSAVLAGNEAAMRGRGMNLSERGQQFNEIASILGQNQTTPTAPIDVMGPANMAMNSSMANQQNQQAKKSSGVNAGSQLGAAYLLGSDRRLKENIVKVAELSNGLNWYEFNYIGNPEPKAGLMADEVELIMPAAVVMRPDGFKMVNYRMVLNG